MDFLNNQVLNAVAAAGQTMQASTTTKSSGKSADDSFQKLLDSRQSAETPERPQTETDGTPAAEQPQEKAEQPQVTETEDPKELEQQMVLAAAAMMQNPVVPVEEISAPDVDFIVKPAEGEPLEFVPLPENLVQYGGQVNGRHFDTPAVDPDTVFEAPEENVEAQPIEADLPVQTDTPKPQEQAVEVKVEVGESAETTEEAPKEAPAETPVFENVRDIPIKVGEPEAAQETSEVPMENQIGDGIAKALEAGETRVELQLEPENLGKVTVELTMQENGSLHVAIHAESGRTANLLERGLDSLHLMLAKNSQQEDIQIEVQHQQESQRQDLYDGRQGHSQQGRERQEQRKDRQESTDFMHQLRLGLVDEA